MSKTVGVFGANGGLGRVLCQKLIASGNKVKGFVRTESIEKSKALLPGVELASSTDNLMENLSGVDALVEVVSNNMRPDGIKAFLDAAVSANVGTFVVMGGAVLLHVDDKGTTIADTDPDNAMFQEFVKLHTPVQKMAFATSIPNVIQICPPYMPADAPEAGNLVPKHTYAAGVMQCSYGDMANIIATTLGSPETYNRKMVGAAESN